MNTKDTNALKTGLLTFHFTRLRVLLLTVIVLFVLGSGLVLVPVVSPATGAAVADQLRVWFGPQPVAAIESISFQIEDALNQFRYRLGAGEPQLSWSSPADSSSAPAQTAPLAIVATSAPASDSLLQATPGPDSGADDLMPDRRHPGNGMSAPALPAAALQPPRPDSVTVTWQPFGPTSAAQSVLARAALQPDPLRPYAQAALVRIDLTQTTLHLVPGTKEPIAAPGVPPFPRPGMIPLDQQVDPTLLAGFNGGFKAVNGSYGMMTGGITILPPIKGLATLALYKSGSVRIGAWGRDVALTPDLMAYRQNCPLLVDAGAINPAVNDENRREWGYTVRNLDTTWRSGVGISQDGRYLVYAAGSYLTVESLARALQAGGAYYAMQLDINAFLTRFVTYQAASKGLVADKLLAQMQSTPTQFLVPYDRDFVYVTLGR